MSTKKTKRNKTHRKKIERKIPDIDVSNGEGFYAVVEKIIGGNRILVKLHSGEEHEATIPGKYRNKVWLRAGSKVLLNESYEVAHIIRDTDANAAEAEKMLRKSNGDNGGIYFQDYESEESEEEELKDDALEIRKTTFGKLDKTKSLLAQKEKGKERDNSRKGGREFTSVEELERQTGELTTSITVSTTVKKNNSDNVDSDVDIDNI